MSFNYNFQITSKLTLAWYHPFEAKLSSWNNHAANHSLLRLSIHNESMHNILTYKKNNGQTGNKVICRENNLCPKNESSWGFFSYLVLFWRKCQVAFINRVTPFIYFVLFFLFCVCVRLNYIYICAKVWD